MVIKYEYIDNVGIIKPVYVFYGHIRNIKNINDNSADKELAPNIRVVKYEKVAELNSPECADLKPHLHLAVFKDHLPIDYYDGYNDIQQPNGRSRPFDCWNCIIGKDWVDANGFQDVTNKDDVFFDRYSPYYKLRVPIPPRLNAIY